MILNLMSIETCALLFEGEFPLQSLKVTLFFILATLFLKALTEHPALPLVSASHILSLPAHPSYCHSALQAHKHIHTQIFKAQ